MGLFSNLKTYPTTCILCRQSEVNTTKNADGELAPKVCNSCIQDLYERANPKPKNLSKFILELDSMNEEELYNMVGLTRNKSNQDFTSNKKIAGVDFDTINRIIRLDPKYINGEVKQEVINVDDILSYELLENDSMVTSGGLGSAVVGGILFGGAGAVAGSVIGKKTTKKQIENVKIKLILNNINNPVVYIDLFNARKPINANDERYHEVYRDSEEILSTIAVLKNSNDVTEKGQKESSNSLEQIKTLKELLDMEAITVEEFETKKKELLGL